VSSHGPFSQWLSICLDVAEKSTSEKSCNFSNEEVCYHLIFSYSFSYKVWPLILSILGGVESVSNFIYVRAFI
jgi:hypothetical protein